MAFRRGFKTEANNITSDIRSELGLGPFDSLDPWGLANCLGIPVLGLSDYVIDAPHVKHFLSVEQDVFSAVTVFRGRRRMIVHNDSHHPHRQKSNLCHELAHGLLQHPPTPALDNRGCRDWNQEVEDEAGWLAGTLLITEPMALAIAKKKYTHEEVTRLLGVSEDMIRFRLNATGAYIRAERAKSFYRQ